MEGRSTCSSPRRWSASGSFPARPRRSATSMRAGGVVTCSPHWRIR